MTTFELKETWTADLRKGALRLPQCTGCGTWNWYPLAACRGCGGTQFAWRQLAPQGKLHSWTRVHRRFSSQEIARPYLVGLVEPVEAPGVRIACRIHTEGPGDPVIDVDGVLVSASNGDQSYWQFKQ